MREEQPEPNTSPAEQLTAFERLEAAIAREGTPKIQQAFQDWKEARDAAPAEGA